VVVTPKLKPTQPLSFPHQPPHHFSSPEPREHHDEDPHNARSNGLEEKSLNTVYDSILSDTTATQELTDQSDTSRHSDQSQDSRFGRILSVFKSLWFGDASVVHSLDNDDYDYPRYVPEISPAQLVFSSRVLALEDFFSDTDQQCTTKILTNRTSDIYLRSDSIGCADAEMSCNNVRVRSFLACIKRLPSPGEGNGADELNKKMGGGTSGLSRNRLNRTITNDVTVGLSNEKVEANQVETNRGQFSVRVVLVDRKNAMDFDACAGVSLDKAIPHGHVLVSKGLRDMMLLEKTGRIQVKSLTEPLDAVVPKIINICPIESLV